MLKAISSIAVFTVAGAMLALPTSAHADDLLIHRVQQEQGMHLPVRGMTMATVQKRYGSPSRKLEPRGGGSVHQPVIKRWDYAKFIVYFEHGHVIHSVLNTPAGNNKNPQQAH